MINNEIKALQLRGFFLSKKLLHITYNAVELDDGFLGNVVGKTDICFFDKDDVECKETNEVCVPLQVEDDWALILICEYNREEASLTAKCVKKMELPTLQNEEILHKFAPGTSFKDAYASFQKSN